MLKSTPPEGGIVVTPDDSLNIVFQPGKHGVGLYVGVGGDVSLLTYGGETLLHKNVPSGSVLICGVKRVNQTNTTATDMIAYY